MSRLLADPADYDSRASDERAEYELSRWEDEQSSDSWDDDETDHPGFGFLVPLPIPSETEAALMVADELIEALDQPSGIEPSDYEPSRPSLAETWPPAERAALARRIARIAPGVSLTELSDAREQAGRPRLSASTSVERHYAPLWLLGARGRAALAEVRAERARLSAGMAPSRAARMRLGELRRAVTGR